ncbi:hypothetical protein AB0L65_31720 [Nonomuraea sp. NPDC052116]|uniref:hypothetical protein n=1 Tax=Nonomuraea sp. NPDC052116 TaxID=3155665 RepID=UPI00341242EE
MFAWRKFTPLLSPAGTTTAPEGGVVGPFSDELPQTAAVAVAVVESAAESTASPLAGVAPPMTTVARATNATGQVLRIPVLLQVLTSLGRTRPPAVAAVDGARAYPQDQTLREYCRADNGVLLIRDSDRHHCP